MFEPDSGSLLFVVLFDVDIPEWQGFLDYISRNFVVVYSENRTEKSLPDAASIFESRLRSSLMLEIMLKGFTVNCHFTSVERIEMNVLPEDVNSAEKAESVFQLMIGIADNCNKPVFLVPEFGSGTDEQLREMAVCIAEPNASIRCRFQ